MPYQSAFTDPVGDLASAHGMWPKPPAPSSQPQCQQNVKENKMPTKGSLRVFSSSLKSLASTPIPAVAGGIKVLKEGVGQTLKMG